MREIRKSGSEGGVGFIPPFLPLSGAASGVEIISAVAWPGPMVSAAGADAEKRNGVSAVFGRRFRAWAILAILASLAWLQPW